MRWIIFSDKCSRTTDGFDPTLDYAYLPVGSVSVLLLESLTTKDSHKDSDIYMFAFFIKVTQTFICLGSLFKYVHK